MTRSNPNDGRNPDESRNPNDGRRDGANPGAEQSKREQPDAKEPLAPDDGRVQGGEARDGKPLLPHMTVTECVRYTLTIDPDVGTININGRPGRANVSWPR